MKKLVLLLLLFAAECMFSQEMAIRKTIETFFAAFHEQDTVKLKSILADEIVLHTITEKASGVTLSVETRNELLQSVASIPKSIKYEERLLSWDIKIDGKLAHVWTPYEFYINGNLVHSGVDSFQLFWDNGIWKIIYCADTRNRP